jgi:hypothetical protein
MNGEPDHTRPDAAWLLAECVFILFASTAGIPDDFTSADVLPRMFAIAAGAALVAMGAIFLWDWRGVLTGLSGRRRRSEWLLGLVRPVIAVPLGVAQLAVGLWSIGRVLSKLG